MDYKIFHKTIYFILFVLCSFCSLSPKTKLYGIFNFFTSTNLNNFSLGGNISGLKSTIILQNELSENLTIQSNGKFNFSTSYRSSSNFRVRILTEPSSQSCTITNSSGTFQNSNITNLQIDCKNNISTLSVLGVNAGNLNPNFSSSIFNYKFSVLNSNSSIILTPTSTDSLSSIQVNGNQVSSGTSSSPVALSVGSNTITILVTAENSSTSTYTLTVIRSTLNAYRIFLTQSLHDGNLVGSNSSAITGADSKCETDTNKPTDGSTYKAFITDTINRVPCSLTNNCTNASENIDWVIRPNTAYQRTNGTNLFTSNSAGIFIFGTLTNSFGTGGAYWTGISSSSPWRPTTGGNHCSLWTSNSSAIIANYGDATSTTYSAIAVISFNCDTLRSLLCVEQ